MQVICLVNGSSGHMEAVGYDLYCKMLNQAVMEAKGETDSGRPSRHLLILILDAFIPICLH